MSEECRAGSGERYSGIGEFCRLYLGVLYYSCFFISKSEEQLSEELRMEAEKRYSGMVASAVNFQGLFEARFFWAVLTVVTKMEISSLHSLEAGS